MAHIEKQLQEVRKRIHSACTGSAESITLVAVSKKQPLEKIKQAFAFGQRDFGESYLQEALEKVAYFAKDDLVWHFIGPVQSNKTKAIAQHFSWVHSVDRVKVAQRLSEQRDPKLPPLNILVQVNASEEAQKAGIHWSEISDFCQTVAQYPNLKLRGLMAMTAKAASHEVVARQYQNMYQAFLEIQQQIPSVDTLSMGMSGDFEIALQCGATMIRVGSLIFGERQ